MGDYNPSENSYDPIMGTSVVENGDLLMTAGVKYVPRGEKGGRLLPIISSSVTSSRTALLLSLLSLLTALVLLALGLASLAPLPSKVAEQHKVSSNSPIKLKKVLGLIIVIVSHTSKVLPYFLSSYIFTTNEDYVLSTTIMAGWSTTFLVITTTCWPTSCLTSF